MNKAGFFAFTILMTSLAQADLASWRFAKLPFGKILDTTIVYEVTTTPPAKLVQYIQRHETDIMVMRTKDSELNGAVRNPLLMGLPVASAELIKQAGFIGDSAGAEARMLSKDFKCCGFKKNTILIQDTSLSYTLIHEFLHSVFAQNNTLLPEQEKMDRFMSSFRRMQFFQNKLLGDSSQLGDPLWRRDILAAIESATTDLGLFLSLAPSEEVIIEKYLSIYIDSKSAYFDSDRKEEGLAYAKYMANNAADIYNKIYDTINWNKQSVRGILESLEFFKEINPKTKISAKDVQDFDLKCDQLLNKIKPVDTEIRNLQKFYSGK